jgi:hypothetical protein
VYVTGVTYGTLTQDSNIPHLANVFVRGYDANGTALWISQSDSLTGTSLISTDTAGDVFLAGEVSAGSWSARKYDPTGTILWTNPYDSNSVNALCTDANGNAYLAGSTSGTLPDQTSAGSDDAVLIKIAP